MGKTNKGPLQRIYSRTLFVARYDVVDWPVSCCGQWAVAHFIIQIKCLRYMTVLAESRGVIQQKEPECRDLIFNATCWTIRKTTIRVCHVTDLDSTWRFRNYFLRPLVPYTSILHDNRDVEQEPIWLIMLCWLFVMLFFVCLSICLSVECWFDGLLRTLSTSIKSRSCFRYMCWDTSHVAALRTWSHD